MKIPARNWENWECACSKVNRLLNSLNVDFPGATTYSSSLSRLRKGGVIEIHLCLLYVCEVLSEAQML